jgi:hypothetical protein
MSVTDPLPAAFADILRQLSPGETAFLDSCYDVVSRRTERLGSDRAQPPGAPEDRYLGTLPDLFLLATGEHAQFGTSPDLFELADGMIAHAASLGLIEDVSPRPDKPAPGQGEFHMTRLGSEFVRACRVAGKMGRPVMANDPSPVTKSPEEQIKYLEKCIYDGDIAAMAHVIGDLHARWDSLGSEMRSDIMKLEAIFLTMLQARSRTQPD